MVFASLMPLFFSLSLLSKTALGRPPFNRGRISSRKNVNRGKLALCIPR
jgi:hypothetical protein